MLEHVSNWVGMYIIILCDELLLEYGQFDIPGNIALEPFLVMLVLQVNLNILATKTLDFIILIFIITTLH